MLLLKIILNASKQKWILENHIHMIFKLTKNFVIGSRGLHERYIGIHEYRGTGRISSKFGNLGYRVPRKFYKLGTAGWDKNLWIPGTSQKKPVVPTKFSTMPTPDWELNLKIKILKRSVISTKTVPHTEKIEDQDFAPTHLIKLQNLTDCIQKSNRLILKLFKNWLNLTKIQFIKITNRSIYSDR